MLSLRPSSEPSQKAVLNLLPCKIHHTGSANAVEKHWSVVSAADTGFKTAHFRGRKLVAKDVSLPAGYTGRVLSTTDEIVAATEEEVDDGETIETKVCAELASFDAITVWGHEQVPESASGDGVLRGIEEWVGWAGKINSWQEEEEKA